jgi:hypothetical protein
MIGSYVQLTTLPRQLAELPPPTDLGVQCLRALACSEDGSSVLLRKFGQSTKYFAPFGPAALVRMKVALVANT